MNLHLTREEFETIPFRQDVLFDYVRGQDYRSRGDENGVYRFMGSEQYPWWWCFGVRFVERSPYPFSSFHEMPRHYG